VRIATHVIAADPCKTRMKDLNEAGVSAV